MFPEILANGIWHTTSPERFVEILQAGAILPEPPLPDSERWGTNCGPSHYPYVRSIGGVSIFDFSAFNEESYSNEYPLSNWSEFVPCRSAWPSSIWIKLKPELLGESFIDGKGVFMRRRAEGSTKRFMPLIEAAHIGPVPVGSFGQVLKYNGGIWSSVQAHQLKAGTK